MRLSLAMILKCLPEYIAEDHISENDIDKQYRNARLYPSEGYLFIEYKNNTGYVYGHYPDSYILVNGWSYERLAAEIVNIYNKYEEWDEKVKQYLAANEYNKLANLMYDIFRNPFFILSLQGRVLSLTDRVNGTILNNQEWTHYEEYGYSSIKHNNKFKRLVDGLVEAKTSKAQRVHVGGQGGNSYLIITLLQHKGKVLARANILEYYNIMTDGDIQLLEYFCTLISADLYEKYVSDSLSEGSGNELFARAISYKGLDIHDRANFIKQYDWKENDVYRIICIDYRGGDKDSAVKLLKDYCDLVFRNIPLTMIDKKIIIMVKGRKDVMEIFMSRLKQSWLGELYLSIGVSLEFSGLDNAHQYYLQSLYTNTIHTTSEWSIHYFYDDAVDFLLGLKSSEAKMCAIHPDIKRLKDYDDINGSEKFESFYEYLINERSLNKASEKLNIHKNTLLYRIKEIKENLQYDIDNEYNRIYMLVSLLMVHSNKVINDRI